MSDNTELNYIITARHRRAVVVAHPDDEVLWCGGLLARYPGNWTIYCCTIPRTDPIRAWKFYDACKVLNVEPRLFPITEPDPKQSITADHMAPILEVLHKENYDLIVTHGEHGEYGHLHHKDIHKILKHESPQKLMCFGYRKGGEGALSLNLGTYGVKRKLDALKTYNHTSQSDKGVPKWLALLNRYQNDFDLNRETYDVCW